MAIKIESVVSTGAKHPKAAHEEMTFSLLLSLSSKVSPRWEDIGLYLGIDPDRLEIIKRDNREYCQDCYREMIKVWYTRVNPRPEWSAIIDAIEHTGYGALAEELRQEHIGACEVAIPARSSCTCS